jgi:hypothetical protein
MENINMTSAFGFARRKNHDCSIDSICVKCYQTIASAEDANKLAAEEEIHICNPFGEFNFQQAAASLPYSGSVALRKEKSLGARLVAHRSCPASASADERHLFLLPPIAAGSLHEAPSSNSMAVAGGIEPLQND